MTLGQLIRVNEHSTISRSIFMTGSRFRPKFSIISVIHMRDDNAKEDLDTLIVCFTPKLTTMVISRSVMIKFMIREGRNCTPTLLSKIGFVCFSHCIDISVIRIEKALHEPIGAACRILKCSPRAQRKDIILYKLKDISLGRFEGAQKILSCCT